jgi:hypothetical protein
MMLKAKDICCTIRQYDNKHRPYKVPTEAFEY